MSRSIFAAAVHGNLFVNTLQTDGAEDRALLGSNLSADSGAKTRLGPASN